MPAAAERNATKRKADKWPCVLLSEHGAPVRVFQDSGESQGRAVRFEGVAHSGAIVEDYFGRVVVSVEGIQTPEREIGLLINHGFSVSDHPRVGVVEKMEKRDGRLYASGRFLLNEENEDARRVVADAKEGYPFQFSIRTRALQWKELKSGETVRVNGAAFVGPGIVIEKCTVPELTICEVGRDPNTSVNVSASDRFAASDDDVIRAGDITPEWLKENKPEVYRMIQNDESNATQTGDSPAPESAASFAELSALFGERSDLIVRAQKDGMSAKAAGALLLSDLRTAIAEKDRLLSESGAKIAEMELRLKAAIPGAAPVSGVPSSVPGANPTHAIFDGATGENPGNDWERSESLRDHWKDHGGRPAFDQFADSERHKGRTWLVRVW